MSRIAKSLASAFEQAKADPTDPVRTYMDYGNILEQLTKDFAMETQTTGGIDLNPLEKELQTTGTGDFHFTDKAMSNIRIDSLTPVVTGIEDLKSLQGFLGIRIN